MTGGGARRPLRAPAPVRRRPRAVRRGVGGLRARARRRLADRRARRPGCRRGVRDAARAGAAERGLPARAARERRSASSAASPASPSPAGRSSAARSPRASPGSGSSGSTSRSAWSPIPLVLAPDPRRARRRQRRRPPAAWRSSPAARSGSCGAWCAATRPAGAALEVVGSLVAGVLLAVGVRRLGAARARADAADALLPLARVLGRQRARSSSLFASLFARRVLPGRSSCRPALGYGPLDAGLRLVPWTATLIVFAPIAGALADRLGERPFMVGGLLLQAVGMALDRADRRSRACPTPSWSRR